MHGTWDGRRHGRRLFVMQRSGWKGITNVDITPKVLVAVKVWIAVLRAYGTVWCDRLLPTFLRNLCSALTMKIAYAFERSETSWHPGGCCNPRDCRCVVNNWVELVQNWVKWRSSVHREINVQISWRRPAVSIKKIERVIFWNRCTS